MKRIAILPILILCTLSNVWAQEPQDTNTIVTQKGDTILYKYTPTSTIEGKSESTQPRKLSFWERIDRYYEESLKDKTFEKKIDFMVGGGIAYSKRTKINFGILASGDYRLDRTDSVTPPSNISILGTISVKGNYSLNIKGYNYLNQGKQIVLYGVKFHYEPLSMWARGYEGGRKSPEGTYVEKSYSLYLNYLHRMVKHLYIGVGASFRHTSGKDFQHEEYLLGEAHHYNATGLNMQLIFDSRNSPENPSKGVYISLREDMYPEALGSMNQWLWRTTFTANWYKQLWKGGVIATDLYGEFNSQGTPWTMLARLGGDYRMRGYYEGRYTDNHQITFQAELRQRIWKFIGFTVWGGAGNVFSSMKNFRWDETLPNYGVGLRIITKKSASVRFDCGFGKNTHGFLLNFNEAF